jgi:invasion protein IalB
MPQWMADWMAHWTTGREGVTGLGANAASEWNDSPLKTMAKKLAYSLAAALLFMSPALAQQPKPAAPRPSPAQAPQQPAPPPENAAPQQTTATYGDWTVQCAQPPGQAEACDMTQIAQAQGKPFSRVAVGKPENGQPVKLVVQVPVNVSFATAVSIQTTEDDPGLSLAFSTCTPNGCFAVFDLKDETLKKFRAAKSSGSFSFADSTGHPVKIPLSFNGFNQALEALAKK